MKFMCCMLQFLLWIGAAEGLMILLQFLLWVGTANDGNLTAVDGHVDRDGNGSSVGCPGWQGA